MAVDPFVRAGTGSIVVGPDRVAQAVSMEGVRSTYSYASFANTPAATPTDILTLTGSASKTIRVTRIAIGGIAGTAGYLKIAVLRRSTANSAGTSTAPTAMKHDTNSDAASGVLALYTANPTTGTLVGVLHAGRVFLPLVTATGSYQWVWEAGRDEQAIVLRGATDILAINGQGDTVPASGVLDLDITWVEE